MSEPLPYCYPDEVSDSCRDCDCEDYAADGYGPAGQGPRV